MKYEIAKVKIWVKFGKRPKPQNIVLVFISKLTRFEKIYIRKTYVSLIYVKPHTKHQMQAYSWSISKIGHALD